jgi:hypothetical protein
MAVKTKPKKKKLKVERFEPVTFGPLSESKHIRLGLYGDTGIGKTRFIGTTPGKVLLVRSPVDHIDSILSAGMGDNIQQRIIHNWEEMDELLDELRSDGARWDWVWYDSWSLMQDVLMDDVWAAAKRRKPERGEFGLDKQEHGINQLRMGEHMRFVIGPDLFNFGWTAHATEMSSPDLDEDGEALDKLMPAIHGGKGAMSVKFCGYSNIVACYAKDKNGRRILHTESSNIYYAKNQFEPKGEDWSIRNPTMPELMSRIEAGRRGRAGKKRSARGASRKKTTSTRKGSK